MSQATVLEKSPKKAKSIKKQYSKAIQAMLDSKLEVAKKKKPMFVKRFPQLLCNITQTCEEVDMSIDCYYDWMKKDPEFRKGVEYGFEKYYDMLEMKLGQEALSGHPACLIFALKNVRPWKWKDNPTPMMGFQNVQIIYGHRNGEDKQEVIDLENSEPIPSLESKAHESDSGGTVWRKGRRIAIPAIKDAESDSEVG